MNLTGMLVDVVLFEILNSVNISEINKWVSWCVYVHLI